MFSWSGLLIYERDNDSLAGGAVKFCQTIPETSERTKFCTSYVNSLCAPIGSLLQNSLLEPASLGALKST